MNRLRRALPFLAWPRPDAALMRGELMAGLTVGLMIIPQGVAYAALAGMPLVTGIYASLLPALVAVLFHYGNLACLTRNANAILKGIIEA